MEQLLTQVRNGVHLLEEKLPRSKNPNPSNNKKTSAVICGGLFSSLSLLHWLCRLCSLHVGLC